MPRLSTCDLCSPSHSGFDTHVRFLSLSGACKGPFMILMVCFIKALAREGSAWQARGSCCLSRLMLYSPDPNPVQLSVCVCVTHSLPGLDSGRKIPLSGPEPKCSESRSRLWLWLPAKAVMEEIPWDFPGHDLPLGCRG